MSTMKEKRAKITEFIVSLYNVLDPTETNSKHFLMQAEKMSDPQFISYFTTLVNDPQKHLYLEIEAFEKGREPTYDMVDKAANEIVGDEYVHLYDYIVFPHLSSDKTHPVTTVNKVFNGYINIRRVQQIVEHKTHIPTSTEKRDPKTGQVTQESKAARISDAEQFAMIVQGTDNIVKEMFGPRGGDAVMREEMLAQIAKEGSCQLENMTDSKLNKTSLNTANVYYISAGYETDLVTTGGLLPRTIQGKYDSSDINRVKREGE